MEHIEDVHQLLKEADQILLKTYIPTKEMLH